MSSVTKSKLALWVSGLYFLLAMGAWVLPIIAEPEENLAGVFLMLFAQPWASIWFWMNDSLKIDSMALTMTVMLVGILLNTYILYRSLSWLSHDRSNPSL